MQEAAEDGTCRVWAVNSFVELFVQSDKVVAENRRRQYYAELESKIGKVDYHRLIQLPDDLGPCSLADRIAPIYLDHFRTIVNRKNSVTSELLLDQVDARYPISFIIIDNKGGNNYLIWQINEYVRTESKLTEALTLHGVFLVVDPDEQIIKFFKRWFRDLEKCDSRRAVTAQDLGLPAGPASPADGQTQAVAPRAPQEATGQTAKTTNP